MKVRTKILAVCFVSGFLLSSRCNDNESNEQSNDSDGVDTVAAANLAPDPAIEAQRIRDSIVQRHILDDDRKKKRIICEAEISAFAEKAMKRVSPIYGRNLNSTVTDETYDDYSRTIEVTFETSWYAFPSALDSQREEHLFTGKVIIYGETGETQIQQISINDALRRGLEETKAGEEWTRYFNEH